MAKTWTLRFQVEDRGNVIGIGTYRPYTPQDSARGILKLVAQLDPPPERLEYVPEKWVEADFSTEADNQLDAVKAQNKIDEKLRGALKGIRGVRISFSNPIPRQ